MQTPYLFIILSVLLANCQEPKAPVSVSGKDMSTAAKATEQIIADSADIQMASVKADEYFDNYPSDSVPPDIQKQLPPGYLPLIAASGDLNRDSLMDWLVSLRHSSEDSVGQGEDSPWPRKLLVFTGAGYDRYQLKAASDSAVYCKTCGGMMGDPFTSLSIKNGYFSIENYGGSAWRWSRTITFRYSPEKKKWILHKDGHESFHASDPEKISTTMYTTKDFGIVPFEQFNIFDN